MNHKWVWNIVEVSSGLVRLNPAMRLLRGVEAIHLSLFDVPAISWPGKCRLLLTCPLWLQTYVSIVNRSIINEFTEIPYGVFITYDLLLIFPQFFCELKRQILWSLCGKDALNDLIKIHDHFEWSIDDVRSQENEAFGHACAFGQLDTAKWLYKTFQLTVDDVRSDDNFAFKYACSCGHLDTAKWLYKTFQLTVEDARSDNNDAFRTARFFRHLNVCDWLIAIFGKSVTV